MHDARDQIRVQLLKWIFIISIFAAAKLEIHECYNIEMEHDVVWKIETRLSVSVLM